MKAIHTYIHRHMHNTQRHINTDAEVQNRQTHKHRYIDIHTRMYMYAHTHTHTHTQTSTQRQKHTHMHTHTHRQTRSHTHTHTRAHTHTHHCLLSTASPKPGVSTTVNLSFTPLSSISTVNVSTYVNRLHDAVYSQEKTNTNCKPHQTRTAKSHMYAHIPLYTYIHTFSRRVVTFFRDHEGIEY